MLSDLKMPSLKDKLEAKPVETELVKEEKIKSKKVEVKTKKKK